MRDYLPDHFLEEIKSMPFLKTAAAGKEQLADHIRELAENVGDRISVEEARRIIRILGDRLTVEEARSLMEKARRSRKVRKAGKAVLITAGIFALGYGIYRLVPVIRRRIEDTDDALIEEERFEDED